ncbi:trypsin-like serine peptidase [Ruegeria atlantica]|uniref:trypsin-like serine peptidase n=1 Tax=Ruegeria atlantica TaxID=81569 RepID=UPI0024948DD2|nr:trypsin-like peptidase domain-containing protein [Ruegeria atlantica]
MHYNSYPLLSTFFSVALIVFSSDALAQEEPLGIENPDFEPTEDRDPLGHWTPQAFADAQSQGIPIPEASFEALVEGAEIQSDAELPKVAESGRYAVASDQIQANANDMLFPDTKPIDTTAPFVPEAAGTEGAYFTSSRLIPEDARLHYPYRVNGKIFFSKPGVGDFICSGTVIRPRLILTAGHCVHEGANGNGGFFSNFIFIPAYHRGNAPYQAWNWTWVATTGSWLQSDGRVPNAGDLAIIEVEDRDFEGETKRIGEVVGWAGFRTNALSPNHTKKVGYPGNHDSGEVMHQVDSAFHRSASENTVLYGSDMRGGSSGGGWFENFGVKAEGQDGAMHDSPNRIVGVTSYGFRDTAPKVQGSSRLGDEFLDLLNLACNHQAGNC